jgi:hypothetical protein
MYHSAMARFLFTVRLLAVLLFGVAFAWVPAWADSWILPSTRAYESANGQFRLTVEPAPIDSQLDYFREEIAASERGTPVDRPAPIGLLERRSANGWAPVWAVPLVNPVAPVDALVADDGKHVVTFDNWFSTGFGEHVIVLYDAAGTVVRSMALTELLPEAYFEALPRSVSSLQWREGADFSPDGTLLELDVPFPSDDDAAGEAPVRFVVSLADGGAWSPATNRLTSALRAAERIERTRAQAEVDRIAYLTQPLVAPSDPEGEWHEYLLEAYFRLTPYYLDSPYPNITVLFAPNNPRYKESVGWLADAFDSLRDFPGEAAIASPQSQDGLIEALKLATRAKRGALAESAIYVSVDAARRDTAERLVTLTGARFVWLDPAAEIAQRPERIPGSAEERAADEERSRRQNAEMDELFEELDETDDR